MPVKYFCTEHCDIDLISVYVCIEMFAIVYCSGRIHILRKSRLNICHTASESVAA